MKRKRNKAPRQGLKGWLASLRGGGKANDQPQQKDGSGRGQSVQERRSRDRHDAEEGDDEPLSDR